VKKKRPRLWSRARTRTPPGRVRVHDFVHDPPPPSWVSVHDFAHDLPVVSGPLRRPEPPHTPGPSPSRQKCQQLSARPPSPARALQTKRRSSPSFAKNADGGLINSILSHRSRAPPVAIFRTGVVHSGGRQFSTPENCPGGATHTYHEYTDSQRSRAAFDLNLKVHRVTYYPIILHCVQRATLLSPPRGDSPAPPKMPTGP